MCAEYFSVSYRPGFQGWFLVQRGLSFINDLWVSSSLCVLKISTSFVELGLVVFFWVRWVPVFLNGFWFDSSLGALNILASAIDVGFEGGFWFSRDSVFELVVVSVRWRFQRHMLSWVARMISWVQRNPIFINGFWVSSSWHDQKIDVLSEVQECRSNK